MGMGVGGYFVSLRNDPTPTSSKISVLLWARTYNLIYSLAVFFLQSDSQGLLSTLTKKNQISCATARRKTEHKHACRCGIFYKALFNNHTRRYLLADGSFGLDRPTFAFVGRSSFILLAQSAKIGNPRFPIQSTTAS